MNLRLPDMSPEMRLLLSCCRPSDSENGDEKTRKLSCSSLDRDAFLELVDRHRVYPFTYINLSRCGTKEIPSYVVDRLFGRVERNTRHALTLTNEFLRLFKLFLQSGIPIIPLKGPILAMQVYGDVGLRHAGDLDLLVAPQHIVQADQILCENGYRHLNPETSLNPSQLALFIRVGDHFTYSCDDRQIKIELHWWWNSDPYLFPLDVEKVWKHGKSITIADTQVKTLGFDDMLLYLCSHGARHAWSRLFWLCDVTTLVRMNPSFDWTRLMARALDLNVGRSLAEGLVMLDILFGDPVPEAVQAYAKKDRVIKRMINMSLKSLVMPIGNSAHERVLDHFRNKLYTLKLCSKPQYKLRCLTSLCTSPRDWSFLRLPDVLFPLYFVLRPFLWFWRWYGKKVISKEADEVVGY